MLNATSFHIPIYTIDKKNQMQKTLQPSLRAATKQK